MADFALSDVDVVAVSLCKGPANRKRFILKKTDAETFDLPSSNRLIKAGADGGWSVVYAVVAEPGWAENTGIGPDAMPGTRDVWAGEDEIRKAAHRFIKNGGLINRQHESLEPYGELVENAVALADFTVDTPDGPQTIKKGSWYIAIEPTEDGRQLIDSGEWDGVSYQGSGMRAPLAKAHARNTAKLAGPIRHLVAHYMRKRHPFTACVRDNTKRFGPDRAKRVCATLKDMGKGHHNWRKGPSKISKADDVPDEFVQACAENWAAEGLTEEDATMALEELMAEQNDTLLQKIADKLGISADDEPLEDDPGTVHREDEMTDEQKAQLAKVDELDGKVVELTKDDGRLAAIESTLSEIKQRLPEPEKNPDEERADLQKSIDEMGQKLQEANERLDTLAEGSSNQHDDPDQLKKTDDPEAALASALFGD